MDPNLKDITAVHWKHSSSVSKTCSEVLIFAYMTGINLCFVAIWTDADNLHHEETLLARNEFNPGTSSEDLELWLEVLQWSW